jgi:hypothetical protein
MSNVLIGIIGVILFIGLALAGALILGDDFRTANGDSKAAAAIQQVQQASQAIAMYRLKTGAPYSQGTLSGLIPRFLKVVPINPIEPGWAVDTRDANGNQSGPAVMAAMGIPATERNKEICLSVARATAMPMPDDVTVPTYPGIPTHPVGCYLPSATFGGIGPFMYVIYSRV